VFDASHGISSTTDPARHPGRITTADERDHGVDQNRDQGRRFARVGKNRWSGGHQKID